MRVIVILTNVFVFTALVFTQGGLTMEFDNVDDWTPMPVWLSNPADKLIARAVGGVAEFRVDEPRKGMKWHASVQLFNAVDAGYIVMRYRALNLAPAEDYLLWVFDAVPGGHQLLPFNAVHNDGQWHTIAIDLWASGVTGNVNALALQVQAGQQIPASLWIDYLRCQEEVPADAERYPKEPPKEMTASEEFGNANEWQKHLDWLDNPDPSATIANDDGAVRLTVPTAGKGMKWSKRFAQPVDLRDARYVAIRYRAENIAPRGDYFVWIGSETGGMPQEYETLLPLSAVEDDGRWHVYVAPLRSRFKVAEMAIQAQADAAPGRAWIDYVQFTSRRPLVPIADHLPYAKGFTNLRLKQGQFVTVDLSRSSDFSRSSAMKALGLADWFSDERITVEGIPFALPSGERSLVSTPKSKPPLTLPLSKGEMEGVVAVPVGRAARELYFLMASILPSEDMSGMLGPRPLAKFSDPERFVARVRYEDGVEGLQFPVRVSAGRYEIVGGIELYCLPELRSTPIQSVALDCRMASGRTMLAGLTLNTGEPLVKRPFISVLPSSVKERSVPAVKASVMVKDDVVTLSTRTLTAKFSVKQGVTLMSLQNKCLTSALGGGLQTTPKRSTAGLKDGRPSVKSVSRSETSTHQHVRFAHGSFFELGAGDKVLTSDKVKVNDIQREKNSVVINIDARPDVPIAGTLRLTATETGEILMSLNVKNVSDQTLTPVVNFPTFSRLVIGDVENTWYFYAREGGIINNVPTRQREPYSGRYPMQVTGLFNPQLGGGMYLLVRDLNDIYKYYVTDKDAQGVDWRIEYFPREYQAGETIETAETALCGNTGDWRAQLADYQRWAKTWYRPMVPRKDWFRDVYNYRQHYVRSDLYDFKTKTYHIRETAGKDREFFGFSDYLHIFDFGQSDTYGRVGDYSHYDEIGGVEKLSAAIADTKKSGTPIGVYIEGYLCDERGTWGREHVNECHIIRKDGSPLLWDGAPMEHMMCPANRVWQDYLAGVYRRVADELKPSGMYIDQHGFGNEWKICWSRHHGHPVPWAPIRGERELGRKIREAVPPHVATLTEEVPTDVNSQVQDGALGYSVAFNDPHLAPHRVDLFRFVFPDFKVFQLVSYNDFIEGGWGLLKFQFFNAEGWWLGNTIPGGFEPVAQQFLRRALTILHAHKETFRSNHPQPLVPTQNPLIYANAFPAKNETVWTLFNADYRTHRGAALAVEHVKGATYRDEWNGVDLKPVIKGRQAILSVTIGPRDVGCIVQRRK